ncbi:hypothetical protein HPB47_022952 [Ixodes persulcatus]|uniref:Uncharacterized protein n=1 Tax=Ixodes persulcatus TaxID=34615 RepID=A0AC60Q889_IXOPE|nr:hypothetical protein HPB47_022952 [Ixodes persulcatus]
MTSRRANTRKGRSTNENVPQTTFSVARSIAQRAKGRSSRGAVAAGVQHGNRDPERRRSTTTVASTGRSGVRPERQPTCTRAPSHDAVRPSADRSVCVAAISLPHVGAVR